MRGKIATRYSTAGRVRVQLACSTPVRVSFCTRARNSFVYFVRYLSVELYLILGLVRPILEA